MILRKGFDEILDEALGPNLYLVIPPPEQIQVEGGMFPGVEGLSPVKLA